MNSHRSAVIATETARGERATRVRWRIVGLLAGFSIVNYVLRVDITIAGEPIMREFHLSPFQLGWVFSAFSVSYTFFMTPAGAWSDRFGPRLILAAAGICWAALTILTAVLPGWVFPSAVGILGSLLIVRLLMGFCQAPMYPAATRAISCWVPKSERAFSNGAVIAGSLLGTAATAPAISYVMVHLGWRTALIVVSVVGPLLVLVWLFCTTDRPNEHQGVNTRELELIEGFAEARRTRPESGTWRSVLKNTQAWRLATAYGCQNYVSYIFVWWGYIYLVEIRKFSLVRGGLAISAPFIVATFTTPAAGALSDWLVLRVGHRRGRNLIPVLALMATAVLVFVGASVESARWAVLILGIGAVLAWTCEGPSWASMMEIAPHVAGTAGGFLNTGGNLGGTLAIFLTPWIAKEFGWTAVFVLASIVAIVGSVLWFYVNPTYPSNLTEHDH